MQDFTFSIVGSGGDGAVVAGDLAAMACAEHGLHVIKTEAYGPQIRGGESSSTVRIATTPIAVQGDAVDALVVFRFADFAAMPTRRTRKNLVASGCFLRCSDCPRKTCVKLCAAGLQSEGLPSSMRTYAPHVRQRSVCLRRASRRL